MSVQCIQPLRKVCIDLTLCIRLSKVHEGADLREGSCHLIAVSKRSILFVFTVGRGITDLGNRDVTNLSVWCKELRLVHIVDQDVEVLHGDVFGANRVV